MWKSLSLTLLRQSHLCTQTRNIQCKAQQIKHRSIIQVSGADVSQFLQGLMTNDIRHLEEDPNKSMYCMFLNTQGRILYDTIIYNGHEKESYLIECDTNCSSTLIKHLMMYRVRRKISVTLNESLKTWIFFDQPQESFCDGAIVSEDPRTSELKWRVVAHPGQIQESNIEITSEDEYTKLRYQLGIGEGVADLLPGKSFPLECNCDYLHGVSFHKGCYLGQELTARTHHTGVIRKRLMPLKFEKPVTINTGESELIIRNEKGRKVGKLHGIVPGSTYGLALMRVQESLSSSHLEIDSNIVSTHRPAWWPIEAPKERSHLEKDDWFDYCFCVKNCWFV